MKWSTLDIKYKSLAVVVLFVLVLILSFTMPIRRTLQLKDTCNNLLLKIEEAKKAPVAISKLEEQKQKWHNSVIVNLSEEELQLKLYGDVGFYAQEHNVKVSSLKQIHSKRNEEFCLQTFEVKLCGNFHSLLKVLHQLEEYLKVGRIVSVSFNIDKQKGRKDERLFLQVLIQSATQNSIK